jgi:hypothetical protein
MQMRPQLVTMSRGRVEATRCRVEPLCRRVSYQPAGAPLRPSMARIQTRIQTPIEGNKQPGPYRAERVDLGGHVGRQSEGLLLRRWPRVSGSPPQTFAKSAAFISRLRMSRNRSMTVHRHSIFRQAPELHRLTSLTLYGQCIYRVPRRPLLRPETVAAENGR